MTTQNRVRRNRACKCGMHTQMSLRLHDEKINKLIEEIIARKAPRSNNPQQSNQKE